MGGNLVRGKYGSKEKVGEWVLIYEDRFEPG